MSVQESAMGTLKDGRKVRRFTLRNANGAEASFTDLGAIWLTMLVPDKTGSMRDVVLGQEDPQELLTNPGHMGEPVGRNANRIGGAAFKLNGHTYALARNDHENNLHSGPDYYRNRLWDAEYADAGLGSYVMFSLHSPDGDQGFPGNAEISVTYTLSEDNALSIHYKAVADADTVFNFTNHAYFNLNGHESGNAMDQYLWLNADCFTPASDKSIPTGEIRSVAGTPMDFRRPKKFSQEIDAAFDQLQYAGGYDHNWCLNDYTGESRLSAYAYAEESGIKMEVYTDLEGVQVYTANSMPDDAPAKKHAKYGRRCGFCLETQHYPDCLNKPQFHTSAVKAGEDYDSETVFKFTVI